MTARPEQIIEAMEDLETVFANPTCFHTPGTCDDRPVQDYAASLASEFCGSYRDDEIVNRLHRLIEAEDSGDPKAARHHLMFVRRKIDHRWRQVIPMVPQIAAKGLFADRPDSPGSVEIPAVGNGARPAA